jgi:alginate O-acetyltransferase complex protein AlgI
LIDIEGRAIMLVTSVQFFILLAATIALVAMVPVGVRKWVLLAASLVFYTASGIASALFMGALIGVNFLFLRGIVGSAPERVRDRLYTASMIFNAAVFLCMKLGFEPAPGVQPVSLHFGGLSLGYPLGLSFIILMLHGAITDAHSGKYVPKIGFSTYLLFNSFFPYASAGPIERLDRMAERLEKPPRPSAENLREGLSLIALGLIKKIVVANRVKVYVDSVFAGDLPNSSVTMVIAIILNVVYIYSDFSGYTDIARGAGRCLGFDLLRNFDRPFAARSVTEFWRRWHMSFSSWLRDYLYMPIAFMWRRSGPLGQSSALLLTFLLVGFWHRATWPFLLFGALHGVALVAETRYDMVVSAPNGSLSRRLWDVAGRLYFYAFVCATVVLFSASSIYHAETIFARMFTSKEAISLADLMAYKGPVLFAFLLAGIGIWQIMERWQRGLSQRALPLFLAIATFALIFFGQPDGGSFIYVQF